jgi:FAD-dependent urate hydroxylase
VFLADRGLRPSDVEPLAIELYLEYAAWFQRKAGVRVEPAEVVRLDIASDGRFDAALDHGTVRAHKVVIAIGLRYFAEVPQELQTTFPSGRLEHSCNFARQQGQGGNGVSLSAVGRAHSSGRLGCMRPALHPSTSCIGTRVPKVRAVRLEVGDGTTAGLARDPTWYRSLSQPEKDNIAARMWGEGRLKVEPWLAVRVRQDSIRIRPDRDVVSVQELEDGALLVTLDGGEELPADIAIAATGYRTDISRIPFVAAGNVSDRLNVHNGCPVLDEAFQTNVPGFYATGALATQDFGPFFGFTLAARSAAVVIGRSIRKRINSAIARA